LVGRAPRDRADLSLSPFPPVIGLDGWDVGWDERVLTIRAAKFNKTRQIPWHASTVEALHAYAATSDPLCGHSKEPSFFVSTAGTRLIYNNMIFDFLKLAGEVGLEARSPK
jgi:site-specific recombinase XerD